MNEVRTITLQQLSEAVGDIAEWSVNYMVHRVIKHDFNIVFHD